MAGVTAALIGGAALSGVGGAMSSRAQSRAARDAAAGAQFNPFDVRGAGGNAIFGSDGSVTMTGDARSQLFQQLFTSGAQDIFGGGGFGQSAIDFAGGLGASALPLSFAGAMQDSDVGSALAAGNLFSNFSNQNAAFGQAAGLQNLNLANMFGTQQTGANEGVAQGLFGQGFNALGNTDFSSLAADQIAQQRAFARPGEERAVNAKFQNLFNRGMLSSTAGDRQIGELALSQEMADIQRVNSAQQFANQLMAQNQQFGLSSIGAGLGARAQDQQFNLGAANLFGGIGQNMMNFGQQSAGQGFNTQLGLNELTNTRGQQRLANVQSLLGFGSTLGTSNLNQALAMFGGSQSINADLRQLAALGGNLGTAQANAGANAGQFIMQGASSPFGGFLGGLGGGLMSGATNGIFG